MRIIKIISCAVLCAFIIICSCLPMFAAEPSEPAKPKNYSQMTEAELLARGQVPISWILKDIQKQIDKTVKNDKGEEERVFNFYENVRQEDGTYKKEPVPVGKFNLVNFLQDKKFILNYYAIPDEKDNKKYKSAKRDEAFIYGLYVFDNDPTLDLIIGDPSSVPKDSSDIISETFMLQTKPDVKVNMRYFTTERANTIYQSFLVDYRIATANSGGVWTSFVHTNATTSNSSWMPLDKYPSFYLNFMPAGGDGKLNPYVVTDKDISSEKQYIDDPDRPDGNYKYGIYEFQNGVMTMAQYFEEQPEVIPSKVGSMTNYTTKHKGKSYVWNVAKNTFTDFSAEGWDTRTTELFRDYPSTNTVTKFSWTPFDGYEGETYEDNALLVDGNGFVNKRPTGSYPYVIKRYVNSKLYETFYFSGIPYLNVSDYKEIYEKQTITFKIEISSWEIYNGFNSGADWYSKKQDVFFVPSPNGAGPTFHETYNVNVRLHSDGRKEGNYLTFNWDTGESCLRYNMYNPFYDHNGEKLDPFYQDNDDIITDDEGNLVGQGDGSKPGQNKGDGFEFGDFEFNSDSLWKYANEFLNFCAKTFSVLPSFIWQIIATGAVIVVILRILGR